MKMKYETPSAEKISFNYRDQIVAASAGGGGSTGDTGGSTGTGIVQDIIKTVIGGTDLCGNGGWFDRVFDFFSSNC